MLPTSYSWESAGMSGRSAVRRSLVEVSGRNVQARSVRWELEDANTATSVRRRLGVAGALAAQTHVARAFNACSIAATAAIHTTSATRCQLFLRLFNAACFLAFYKRRQQRHIKIYYANFIMVARSSVAIARIPLYFAESLFSLFFFSRHTFSDVEKSTSPKLSHTTWISHQQNLCYTDFFKVPLKRTGAGIPKISQTISAAP